MPDLIPFYFGSHAVRIEVDDAGNPWWIAKDVCDVLAIKNVSNAVGRLLSGEKGIRSTDKELIINESGLYRLIFRSDKPQATKFQTWVFEEVLPSIRKTGKYEGAVASPLDNYPELRAIADLAVSVAQARDIARTAQIEAAAARADAAQANANVHLVLQSQLFQTVAEYVYINKLQHQVPEPWYRALSDHLRLYCGDRNIPFRKVPVGGKRWEQEWAYLQSVYVEILPGWLKRRYAQDNLTILYPPQEGDPA